MARLTQGSGMEGTLGGFVTASELAARGNSLQSFGNEAFHALETPAKMLVYGVLFGGSLAPLPECPDDWARMLSTPSIAGTRKAMFVQGLAAFLQGDTTSAIGFWRRAMLAYESNSVFALGVCHLHGCGVKKDVAQAHALFQTAADLGHLEALYALGTLWLDGRGCTTDAVKAVECWLKGHKANHQGCRYRMALCHWNGIGVCEATGMTQDYEAAVALLQRVNGEPGAAEQLRFAYAERYVLTEEEKHLEKEKRAAQLKKAERTRKEQGYPIFLGRAQGAATQAMQRIDYVPSSTG
jgi:hypothetical protein